MKLVAIGSRLCSFYTLIGFPVGVFSCPKKLVAEVLRLLRMTEIGRTSGTFRIRPTTHPVGSFQAIRIGGNTTEVANWLMLQHAEEATFAWNDYRGLIGVQVGDISAVAGEWLVVDRHGEFSAWSNARATAEWEVL